MITNGPLEPEDEIAELKRLAARARDYAFEHQKVAAGLKKIDRSYMMDELRQAQFYEERANELEQRIRALSSRPGMN